MPVLLLSVSRAHLQGPLRCLLDEFWGVVTLVDLALGHKAPCPFPIKIPSEGLVCAVACRGAADAAAVAYAAHVGMAQGPVLPGDT